MECAWLGVERRALPRGRGPIIGGAGYMCCIIMKEASLSLSLLIFICSVRDGVAVALGMLYMSSQSNFFFRD